MPDLHSLITLALGHPLFLIPAISLVSMFLEDPTIVAVGILSATGIIAPPVALGALYVGIVCGDCLFYGLGRYARAHPRLERYIHHTAMDPVRVWLEAKYVITLFTARFIPGSRLPTYAASGFIRIPFRHFLLISLAATTLWTTTLFLLAYVFGNVAAMWVEQGQWPLALAALVALAVSGRQVLHTLADQYVKKRQAP
jgi:membrane protein DedA with SNARE-associated domain